MAPVLAMFLAALLWASSMIGAKLAVAELAITEVVSGRFFFAVGALWLIILITRQPVNLKKARRPLVMGILDPGLVSLFMVWGLFHTSAVNASVFWALMPLVMPIAGRLVLKEAINPMVIVGAVLAVGGALMLVSANQSAGEGSLFGDMLAICGVLCAVLNALLARRVAQTQGRPMVTTAWQMTMALLIGGAALLVLEQPGESVVRVAQGPLALLIYLGVATTAGPFFLLNYALRHLPVGRTALFSSLVGPLSVPMAAVVLGETIQGQEIAAIAIVMLGVFLPSLIGPEFFARFKPTDDPRPLADLTFVVFDTETTGLQPSRGDRIVQIAAVRIVNGVIQEDQVFEEIVDPGRTIPPLSTTFHGLTDADVAGCRRIGPVLRDFHEFCGDSVLVAHNAAFDMKFLERAKEDGAPAFEQPVLDTLLLSAVLEPGARDHDLDALAARHGTTFKGRHTALGDSLATAEVFLKLLVLAETARTLGELTRLSRKARQFRRLQRQY